MKALILASLLLAGCAPDMTHVINRYYDLPYLIDAEHDRTKRETLRQEQRELGVIMREWRGAPGRVVGPSAVCMPSGNIVICG